MAYEPFPPQEFLRWVMPKPVPELMRRSLPDRWEFTRRHPYYLRFRAYAAEPDLEVNGKVWVTDRTRAARQILGLIGVYGVYPPPDATPAELELEAAGLGAVWADGALAPQTFRGLLAVLLTDLPPESQRMAGTLLHYVASLGPDDLAGRFKALEHLTEAAADGLDGVPNRPLVGVNLYASKNVLVKSFDALVARLKAGEDIPDARGRGDKTAGYLAVWDLVEGWTGAGYDFGRAETLKNAAKTLAISVATARGRYRSAYRAVVGRDYAYADWYTLFGGPKIGSAAAERAADLPPRYRVRGGPRQSVPLVAEATLGPAPAGASVTTRLAAPADDGVRELLADIRTLLAAGRTDAEIMAALDLPLFGGAIEYLRGDPDMEV